MFCYPPVWKALFAGGDCWGLFGKKQGRVPLTNDVANKCMCGICPVQAESACAQPKIRRMMEIRTSMKQPKMEMGSGMSISTAQPPMEMKLNPQKLAGPYCSSGVASCRDLNVSKACICTSCQVYREYNLSQARPVEHFCFNDKAI